jgi:HEAT repeat protein
MPPDDRVPGTIPQGLCYRLPVHLTCLAIVGYTLAAASASAPASSTGKPGDERPKLEAFLADNDVPTAAQLRALSRAPQKPLQAIAVDARAPRLVRARAVAALRLFPSAETRVFLGNLIETNAKARDATELLLVRRAAVALGWMAGAGVCQQLALLFTNDDVEVRVDAAIGLGLTRAPEAPALLRKQLAVEATARVRDQIERQLRALPQPPPPPPKKPQPERQPMRSGF